VELLWAREHLGLLEEAAVKYELDARTLKAVAAAAMAAPMSYVTVEVGNYLADEDEPEGAKAA
jgi:hypothetical protein